MHKATLLALALMPVALPAAAQTRSLELGVGVASASYINFGGSAPGSSAGRFAIGGQAVQFGVYLAPSIAIEASVIVGYDQASDQHLWSLQFDLGVPIYLQHNWGHQGTYVTPHVGVVHASYTDGISTSQLKIGVGVGRKFRFSGVISGRIEVRLSRVGEDDALGFVTARSYTSVSGLGGVSIFIH